jgi:hypothetical protein
LTEATGLARGEFIEMVNNTGMILELSSSWGTGILVRVFVEYSALAYMVLQSVLPFPATDGCEEVLEFARA